MEGKMGGRKEENNEHSPCIIFFIAKHRHTGHKEIQKSKDCFGLQFQKIQSTMVRKSSWLTHSSRSVQLGPLTSRRVGSRQEVWVGYETSSFAPGYLLPPSRPHLLIRTQLPKVSPAAVDQVFMQRSLGGTFHIHTITIHYYTSRFPRKQASHLQIAMVQGFRLQCECSPMDNLLNKLACNKNYGSGATAMLRITK